LCAAAGATLQGGRRSGRMHMRREPRRDGEGGRRDRRRSSIPWTFPLVFGGGMLAALLLAIAHRHIS